LYIDKDSNLKNNHDKHSISFAILSFT